MTSAGLRPGEIVWSPPDDVLQHSRIGAFLGWLADRRGLELTSYDLLWQWSIDDPDGFWSAVWEFFDVRASTPFTAVLADPTMPGAVWFPGARLNYAEHLLRQGADDEPALLGRSQTRDDLDLSFGQLREQVARARAALSELGVGPGDRVAAYLPNVPEAVVAFLATASLGAVWASCASEFGARAVVDRFAQIEPSVLLVAGGYQYGRKAVDRTTQVSEIRSGLPSVRHVLDIEYGPWRVPDTQSWSTLLARAPSQPLVFAPLAFDAPLFVLFSSGTTGLPKAIVHGHGGILLEHLKNHALSWDLGPGDRLFWYSTTAWMMWNALVSALLVGASAVLLDGDPGAEELGWQWRLAAETSATMLGVSPGYVMACRSAELDVTHLPLKIRTVGAAGAPMPPEAFAWIADQLGAHVMLIVGSGGTDVCSGIVQGNPMLPVLAGRIAGPALAVDAHAFDPDGHVIVGEPGELVITSPMPSMPVGFWNDPDGSRLRAAYFETFPGVWRHGDWIVFYPDRSCEVTGRSDATLNRGGVRLGTADFYRVVEELEQVRDSLVIHLEDRRGGNGELLLFVVPAAGSVVDAELCRTITGALRQGLSPRHVPDQVLAMPGVPRNLSGKKLELPVKRILQGARVDEVASRDALADPVSLDAYVEFARARQGAS